MTAPSAATANSIPIEDPKQWRGRSVLDRDGQKLGRLDEVYYDTQTDTPAFAAVKSGRFGKRVALIALAGATAGQEYLRLAIDKDRFKGAPSFDPDAELSGEDEASAYGYFGIDYQASATGARRLAKH
jgi:hypothetical protein